MISASRQFITHGRETRSTFTLNMTTSSGGGTALGESLHPSWCPSRQHKHQELQEIIFTPVELCWESNQGRTEWNE